MAQKPVFTTVAASAARTTSGSSDPQAVLGSKVAISATISAVSGTTPSMTLVVEWSNDGTNFGLADPTDTFTAITTAVTRSKAFDAKARFFRLAWTITGTTPSFTFVAAATQT